MPVFRFLSALSLLVAVVALVADATPATYGMGPFSATAISTHFSAIAPTTIQSAEEAVTAATAGWVWSTLIAPILAIPTFVLFGVLSLVFGYVGRRRRQINIFVN